MPSRFPAAIDGTLAEAIKEAKVLVVGAGGIGCELLKGIIQIGITDIDIVDMDTIEVSNLNRQFLFRKQHVGMSKAMVARESVLKLNPEARITAHHTSITSTEFGVSFFKGFNLVMNALDNRAARSYVNQMCLIADVPLIESGTAGYTGQVELIKKGLTQCYDCLPKVPVKSYPACTIRNTPSEPIHCIVWAKFLFNQLFGEEDADEDVSPDMNDPELNDTDSNLKNGSVSNADTIADSVDSGESERDSVSKTSVTSTRKWAQNVNYNPEQVFEKLFCDDINYLLKMEKLWANRRPPNPVKWKDAETEDGPSIDNSSEPQNRRILSLKENRDIFKESLTNLRDTFMALEKDKVLVWDKDDRDAMNFVAAAANIRAHIFNIPKLSQFDIKSMAGRIIPAIATSNAIIAGLICLFAMNVLMKEYEKCKTVYLRSKPNPRNKLLIPETCMTTRNPKCQVCSSTPMLSLSVDVNKVTIDFIKNEVLKKHMNMAAPEMYIKSTGSILISSDDDDDSKTLQKTLSEMNVNNGAVLVIEDFDNEIGSFYMIITNKPSDSTDMEYYITGEETKVPEPEPEPESLPGTSKGQNGETDSENVIDDDDLVEVPVMYPEFDRSLEEQVQSKRKADFDSDLHDAKKMKVDNKTDENNSETMCID